VLLLASFFDLTATAMGFMAASIAVGGFLAHAEPVLSERGDQAIRSATVRGGLWGFFFAVAISFGTHPTG
jgi:hypothetical protein